MRWFLCTEITKAEHVVSLCPSTVTESIREVEPYWGILHNMKKKSEVCYCWDGEKGSPSLQYFVFGCRKSDGAGYRRKLAKNMHLLPAKVLTFCKFVTFWRDSAVKKHGSSFKIRFSLDTNLRSLQPRTNGHNPSERLLHKILLRSDNSELLQIEVWISTNLTKQFKFNY